ncbi:MAG: hypothetical protein CR967_01730 [Proteobacteria bacterium]|nr:MAG: hypothetical protein CR967_01730 [Pseudomonadota bacterium]
MLDIIEIKDLEKRWLIWKIKSILKIIFIFCIILFFILTSWLIYSYLPLVAKNINTKPSRDQVMAKNETLSQNTIEQYIENNEENSLYGEEILDGSEEELIELEDVENVDEVEQTKKVKIKKNTPNKKPKINIQSSNMEKYSHLIEKFDSTKNVIFALMIAEEYYHDKDYKSSLRWSIRANSIDPKNERSWIIFAKSMAKNGSSEDAINALQEYLKQNPNSSQIKSLIFEIQNNKY